MSIWVSSYLAIDLIMWMGGRSTLVSNIVISLPMMATAPALTISLERLRRHVVRLGIGPTAAILVPAAILAAMVQGIVDYSSVRIGAALLFPEWADYVPTENRQFGFGIYVYALHFLCCLLALSLLHARQSVEIAIERQTEAVSAHRRAEAKALRLQLNPHFLFNALNSIAALVATGGNRVADAMICRLSDFLRASIVGDPESDVSLSSEIATAESYLAIEQLRYGNRLSAAFTVTPDAWDAAIPAFILQPLAENAVKHGLAAKGAAIRLTIDVRLTHDLVIIAVTNRRVSTAPVSDRVFTDGMGIGLGNVRDRVALFGADRAKLETESFQDGFCARLTIPYRRFPGAAGAAP
ncbi:MAG TPA: histidine kinase [Sphingopyxis sp.]|nr:histidine kinase [Sphingopyxis sp.]